MPDLDRPGSGEYAPYYANYVQLVPDGDILQILVVQGEQTLALFGGLDDQKAIHRYEPGKWSIKEVMGHLVDTERLFAFRALWCARNDPSAQPGMEQDDWVVQGRFDRYSVADLTAAYRVTREASLLLFQSFDAQDWLRRGTANEVEFSVRAFPFIVAGHERHHLRILEERYL